uniref:Reverse transcriptase zinc-binding domain-containing protein n=1 Tax=Hordeum vulgare subsp. vulgare TaxID=112509 RepID=A0A8I6Y5C4_HORVV
MGQFLQLWQMIADTILTDEPDRLIWKWTATGAYSARSAYLATFHGSVTCPAWKMIWKAWTPPKVRFFLWLAQQDRCWTADRLARRGLQHHPRCLLCDQAFETIHHIIIACPFTQQIWHEVLAWFRLPVGCPNQEDSLLDWWNRTRHNTPHPQRKGMASITLLLPWMVWKHRNDCVFDRAQPSIAALMSKIKEEATLWARAGAKGLRVILPQTWDVH